MSFNTWNGYSGWGEWYPRLPMNPLETDPKDITKLMFSAKSFMSPTQEVYRLLQEIASKTDFARQLKRAAELNQNQKVDQLIKSTGVQTDFETRITPDGIRIEFQPDSTDACFDLTLSLCW
ncbi:hypothetical protein [Alkalihalobacillus sp. AL-G]|uniref:hypothetical protein n=1 Tax=Alkalihalobacillus sp. AL-G TaxID=2926399 RepID=UPI0027297C8E|nr:hypothetical protein [Alkalihalobacillus sp. AL-G]WLD94800.1 hypothetical protein MOJ78_07935 [Alkalihalobacillus sp. AL-G]